MNTCKCIIHVTWLGLLWTVSEPFCSSTSSMEEFVTCSISFFTVSGSASAARHCRGRGLKHFVSDLKPGSLQGSVPFASDPVQLSCSSGEVEPVRCSGILYFQLVPGNLSREATTHAQLYDPVNFVCTLRMRTTTRGRMPTDRLKLWPLLDWRTECYF